LFAPCKNWVRAARLCAALGAKSEPARDLAYRLYSICERKGWASEALAYNSLVVAWPEIKALSRNPNIALPDTRLSAFTQEHS
jgi:adenine-specific DNA methylase